MRRSRQTEPKHRGLISLLVVIGVGWGAPRPCAAEALRVFAASSLTEAFREIGARYQAEHPGISVELNFAGTQVLRAQLEQGAQADVFASADSTHAEALLRQGLLHDIARFARNRLVVIIPASGARVQQFADLARPGIRLVVAGPAVPAGAYALQVIARAATTGGFGSDFRQLAEANVMSHETNVRFVLSKVALGEADAGFVYATDAATSAAVRSIEIPEPLAVRAEYTIGVVGTSAASSSARAFVTLVRGAAGQAILHQHGFVD